MAGQVPERIDHPDASNLSGHLCVEVGMDGLREAHGSGGAALVTDRAHESQDFAALYAAHHGEALRLAYLLCGDADRAQDLVADAFVKLYRRLARGVVDQPRAYLRRIVVNETNSRFRRLALERREASTLHGDDRGQLDATEALATQDATFAALRALPERMRTAVVLRYWLDLTERETAAAMGVSAGTVKSTTSRALDKLRELLGEET